MSVNQKKQPIPSFLFYCLPIIVLIWFYLDIFLAQGAWLVSDHAEQHFPWAYYLHKSIKLGVIPFWTQGFQAGFPILAEGQIGAFYLPNLLFYFALPLNQGYAWNIAFHLLLSALFFQLYLKSLNLDARAVAFGVLVYLFGATLGGAYYNITSLKVLTWFPLALWIIDKMIAEKKFRLSRAICLGLLYTFQLLVGYLQYAVYAMVFSGFYFLARTWSRDDKAWPSFLKNFGEVMIAGCISAILFVPQLLATAELAFLSNRSAPSEEFAYIGSYSPFALICFLFPSMEGLFVSKMYLGIAPLLFILFAILTYKQSHHKAIYWLAALSLFLALGGYNPIYRLMIKLSHFYSFRTPVKFVYFLGFFLSVMAAIGMHLFVKLKNVQGVFKQCSKLYLFSLFVLFAGTIAAYFAFMFLRQPLYELGEWLVRSYIYGKAGHPHAWPHYEAKLNHFLDYALVVLNPLNKVIWLPILKMLLVAGSLVLLFVKRISSAVFYFCILAILIFDLNFTYNDIRGDYQDYESFYATNATTDFLIDNLDDSRYFVYSEGPDQAPLVPGKALIYELDTANAYSPLVMKRYYDFLSHAGGVNDSTGYHQIDDDIFLRTKLKYLSALNVKYILSNRQLKDQRLTSVHQDGEWVLYQNRSVLPKYQLVDEVFIKDDEEAVPFMDRDAFDFRRMIVLNRTIERYYGKDNAAPDANSLRVQLESDHRIVLRVEAVSNQVLSVANVMYPGWRVKVDGTEEKVYRGNFTLMAIPLKKGTHSVELYYKPYTKDDI